VASSSVKAFRGLVTSKLSSSKKDSRSIPDAPRPVPPQGNDTPRYRNNFSPEGAEQPAAEIRCLPSTGTQPAVSNCHPAALNGSNDHEAGAGTPRYRVPDQKAAVASKPHLAAEPVKRPTEEPVVRPPVLAKPPSTAPPPVPAPAALPSKTEVAPDADLDEAHARLVRERAADARRSVESARLIEAAKWMLATALGGAHGQPSLPLAETLGVLFDGLYGDGQLEAVEPASQRAACERRFGKLRDEARGQMLNDLELASAKAAAQPMVDEVLSAKLVVIDPNMTALVSHLDAMRADQLRTAVNELNCGRIRSVIKAKALQVHRVLMAALDDVEMQFCDGMSRQVETQPSKVPAGLPEWTNRELCKAAVRAHRAELDAMYTLEALEAHLEGAAAALGEAHSERARKSPATDSSLPTMDSDPLAWLLAVVMGTVPLMLEDEVLCFLCSRTATYLDPFIDGEVPADEYESRSAGAFLERLRADWANAKPPRASAETLPISPELALAQYVRHAVTKMNLNLGFGGHVPGLGRQPIMPDEQVRHGELVSKAIMEAIERDFEPAHRCIKSTPITAEVLEQYVATHLRACVMYQEELGNALAAANKDGEEARQQERLRIWGYC